MRYILPITIMLATLTSCKTVRDTFNGDVYRSDRPWWDSRTDRPDGNRLNHLQLDIATICVDTTDKWKERTYEYTGMFGKQEALKLKIPDCSNAGGLAYDAAKNSAIARDMLQNQLMKLSDEECSRHLSAVVGTNAGSNLLLSALSSLFSGGATAFSAASTKTALSGTSTFFIASRSHLNEQVYHQLFVGTILKAIDDDRHTLKLGILDRQRYPVPNEAWDPREAGGMITPFGALNANTHEPPGVHSAHSSALVSKAAKGDIAAAARPLTSGGNAEPAASSDAVEVASQASTPSEARRFYSVDEAIRDVGEYHDRCSFYSGLVRVALTVQAASPCDQIAARREQLLSEMVAMRAAKVNGTAFKDKFDAYQTELNSLASKLATCQQTGNR